MFCWVNLRFRDVVEPSRERTSMHPAGAVTVIWPEAVDCLVTLESASSGGATSLLLSADH